MSDPISTTSFAPGGTATTSSPSAYVIPLNKARFILKGQYFNPLRDTDAPLPAHSFHIFDASAARMKPVFGEPSQADGVSWILYEDDLRVDTAGSEWALAWRPLFKQPDGSLAPDPAAQQLAEVFIDLEKNEWVSPGSVRFVDPRRLLRLPLWASFLKANAGGFKESPKGTAFATTGLLKQADNELRAYGTPAKPWLIQMDHGLHRSWVRLHYYDPVEKARKPVPHGILLAALGVRTLSIGPTRGDPRARVAAATSLDDQGTFYLLHERTKAASVGAHYYFATGARGTTDHCIIDYAIPAPATGKPDERLKIVTTDVNPRPDARYVLPTEWHSYGMQAWLDEGTEGAPQRKPYKDLRAAETAKAKPLSFHLDDAVLAAGPVDLAPLGKDQRIAIFDHLLHLRDVDPKKPHLWKTTLRTNYLPAEDAVYVDKEGIERVSRLAYVDGVFYDLRDRRLGVLEKEKLGVTPGVGARAFVANDFDDRHKMVSYMNGNPVMPVVPRLQNTGGVGRSEFHLIDVSYLKHALPLGAGGTDIELVDMGLLHLLVFVPLTLDTTTSSQTEREAFLPLLTTASERWDQEHPAHPGKPDAGEKPSTLALVPRGGAVAGKSVVKVRHYFGEVPRTFPNAITIFLRKPVPDPDPNDPRRDNRPRTHSLAREMNMIIGAIEVQSGGVGEDGQVPTTTSFGFAHELGHILGFPDEYVEPLEFGTFVRGWNQYEIDHLDGRPFFNAQVGIMNGNNKPRLRHYWNYANRISAEADFRKVTSNEDYVPCDASAAGGPLLYELPFVGEMFATALTDKGPYFGCRFPRFTTHPTMSRVGATLYRLGQDEDAIQRLFKGPGGVGSVLPPASRYDALMLVRLRFMFDFERALDNPLDRATHYQMITDLFSETDRRKPGFLVYRNYFAIEVDAPSPATANAHTPPYLRRIALAFVPEFDYKSRFRAMKPPRLPPFGELNIKIVSSRPGPHPLLEANPTGEMELMPGELDLSLLRYALCLPTYAEDPATHARTLKTTISADEIQPIANSLNRWLQTPPPTRRVARLA